MPSIRQLEYFVAVVDLASFTRAAETLRVTQPALSHLTKMLEKEVGAALLERLPRGVRPTAAGRAMLTYAQSAIAEAQAAVLAARRAAGLIEGELRVATVYSITLGLLPPALTIWSRRHPAVHLRLFEHRHSQELADSVADGQADLAVGPEPQGWREPTEALGTEQFVVVVSADDPLSNVSPPEVKFSALADRRWVHFAPDHGLADVLDRACAYKRDFQPRVAVRTEQTASAPLLAAAGVGPALVPANLVPETYEGVLLAPVPPVHRRLTAYTRTRFDALSVAFIDVLRETAARKLRPAP
ncbi:LysR family transcriptional regulator [Streptomyces anthocyanicus]|uniref:LysR family transcriptional regulator n=1 Tax=Streptomyces anthocyanicus TaxID=68174 RepID=UPI002F910009|nr:LysR family transcriptional regulator [Streptomyces anthocyanicus]